MMILYSPTPSAQSCLTKLEDRKIRPLFNGLTEKQPQPLETRPRTASINDPCYVAALGMSRFRHPR